MRVFQPNTMNTPAIIETQKTIPLIFVIALFLLWITPGIVGRDLWKADEPYSFGIVNHIVATGDWVVPSLAGEPFMEKPPIFYMTAAGFVKLCSPWLQPHDAARLASAFFMLLTMLFMGLAARELFGKDHVSATLIILIGSSGLLITAHKLITDNALMAGISMAIYGLALCNRRPVPGGFWIGTGAGVGFMAKGLLAPGLIALTALALFFSCPDWRKRITLRARIAAYGAALPWLVIWPAALYIRSPALFQEWFWFQNLGRFFGISFVGREFSPFFYLMHLPWFALPSLPIALCAAWQHRGVWRERTGMQLPLVAFLVMLTVLSLSSSIRNIYALPMLLPLSLLAAAGVDSLSDRAKTVMNRIALALGGLLASVLWIGWFINLSGTPIPLARRLYQIQPDYIPLFRGPLFAIAGVYTVMWIFTMVRSSRYAHFYLLNWTAGIVLAWGLLMTIWLPWIDVGSTFRPVFTSLRGHIPSHSRSVMTLGLGESECAFLEYYTGVMPRPLMGKPERAIIQSISKGSIGQPGIFEYNHNLNCDWLLVQNIDEQDDLPPGSDWKPVWEVRRPRNPSVQPRETFTLLKRNGGKKMCD
jgi:4-amino-4-deoxy-L-arabinose transferase-like glycosyltransferase